MRYRLAFIVAVFVLGACACGSTESDEAEPPVAPGTWLRARWLVMEDGARQPAGFWDQKNQFACSFQLSADGRFRCLPSRVVVPFDAYPRDRCLPKPDFRMESRDRAGCSGWNHVLRDATSEEISPRHLARSWQIVEGEGRIAAKIRVSIDGAREFVGWYDRRLGVSCSFGSIDETKAACLPHGDERSAPISGSTCDGPVAEAVVMADCDGSDPPILSPNCPEEGAPANAKYHVVVGPTGPVSIRRVGGHASGAFSISRTGKGGITTCEAPEVCVLGPNEELETRPLLGPSTSFVTSGSRLTAYIEWGEIYYATIGQGASAAPPLFRDTKLGIDCRVANAADDKPRCVPLQNGGYLVNNAWADDRCTQPLVYPDDAARAPPYVSVDRASYEDHCRELLRVYRVERRMVDRVYSLEERGCIFVDSMYTPPGDNFVGTEIDPTEFVGGELATE